MGAGTFLSGGIDSSVVTAIAALSSTESLRAYTMSFHDNAYDELPFAREVAEHYPNIQHRVLYSSQFKLDLDFVDLLLKHLGQPFGDSSAIPMYLISKEASAHEKVILSGDGGDELFFGYDTTSFLDTINRLRPVPSIMKKLALALVSHTPSVLLTPEMNRRITKALRYADQDNPTVALSLNSLLEIVDIDTIQEEGTFKWFSDLKRLIGKNHTSSFEVLQQFLLTQELPADMLRKVDRMSMARSIEVRVPLLDNRIVDFALRLPLGFCFGNGLRKRVLKEVAKKLVPQEVLRHKKWGFSMPMHKVLERSFLQSNSRLLRKYEFVNKDLMDYFYESKLHPTPSMHRKHSQYTIDHFNWMLLLLHRWVESTGVAY